MSNFRDRRTANRVVGPRRLFKSGADKLAGSERQGLFLDFTDRSVRVRDNTTAANRLNPPRPNGVTSIDPITSLLTYTSPSVKHVTGADGVLRRNAQNLVQQSQTLNNAYWTKTNLTSVTENSIQAPDGTLTGNLFTENSSAGLHRVSRAAIPVFGSEIIWKCYVKAGTRDVVDIGFSDGSNFVTSLFNLTSVSTTPNDSLGSVYTNRSDSIAHVGNGWYLCAIRATYSGTTNHTFVLGLTNGTTNSYTGDGSSGAYFWGAHLMQGPADETYLPTTTAARYSLPYDHSPTAIGTCRGLLVEEARTNLCLYSNDLANAAWTKTNCTAAKTATGPGGVANSASTLTATAGNATCLQAITSASAARITSCYIKRRTGTGDIEMTQDNGSTWAAVTVTADWTRVNIAAATLANPTVGLRIVTSGDAVDVSLFDHEVGSFITSPIETVGSTVTRAVDNITMATSVIPSLNTECSMYAELSKPNSVVVGVACSTVEVYADANNRHSMAVRGNTGNFQAATVTAGVTQSDITGGTVTANVNHRHALAAAANDFAHYADGTQLGTDVSGTMPTVTGVIFGKYNGNNSVQLNGHLRRAVVVPRRKSNSEMAKETQR